MGKQRHGHLAAAVAIALAVAGCSSGGAIADSTIEGAPIESTSSTVTGANVVTATSRGDTSVEPGGPLRVDIELVGDLDYGANALPFGVILTGGAKRVVGRAEAKGVVDLVGGKFEWPDLETATDALEFTIADEGEGSISLLVAVADDDTSKYRVTIYVYAVEDYVLAGFSGMVDLKLEDLDRKLENGQITQAEHQEAVEAVLSGDKVGTPVVTP